LPSLLYAGDLDTLRSYLANSLTGAALRNEGNVREGLASWFEGAFASWTTHDGHCLFTFGTWLQAVRGVAVILEEDTEASRAALRAWLPPAAELLRIAEYECGWRAHSFGGTMGPLLFARLHGERLGDWAAAAQVAEGVLALESFQPLLRSEAHRLLGRARMALGERADARKAVESAVSEAKAARYIWLEMLATRQLARLCEQEAGEAEAMQARVLDVEGRMEASPAELAQVRSVM